MIFKTFFFIKNKTNFFSCVSSFHILNISEYEKKCLCGKYKIIDNKIAKWILQLLIDIFDNIFFKCIKNLSVINIDGKL